MKRVYLLFEKRDVYSRITADSITGELKENCPECRLGVISGLRDVVSADRIIICGRSVPPKRILWGIKLFRKRYAMYGVPYEMPHFARLAECADWVSTSSFSPGCDCYPSPVVLGDTASPGRVSRIWSREKLASKRGSIIAAGLGISRDYGQKLADAFNLLIEDMDINIIFMPLSVSGAERDIAADIKYSANTGYIQSERYSSGELLGIAGRADILVTADMSGAVCAMAAGRPFVFLSADDGDAGVIGEITEEEIALNLDRLSAEELYSRIKIAWVHRNTIAEQMQKNIPSVKKKAVYGLRDLCKGFIK